MRITVSYEQYPLDVVEVVVGVGAADDQLSLLLVTEVESENLRAGTQCKQQQRRRRRTQKHRSQDCRTGRQMKIRTSTTKPYSHYRRPHALITGDPILSLPTTSKRVKTFSQSRRDITPMAGAAREKRSRKPREASRVQEGTHCKITGSRRTRAKQAYSYWLGQ